MKKSRLFGTLCAAVLSLVTRSSQAALVSVLGGQAVSDTDLGITWTANANLADTVDFGVTGINADGTMTWDKAHEWIAAMNTANHLGFNDWRMPTTLQPDASCDQKDFGTGVGFGGGCTGSEMGHLANIEGVNSDGGPGAVVLGLFSNVLSTPYWSSSEFEPDPTDAWTLSFNGGDQRIGGKDSFNLVWAVSSGVSEAPVPASVWLFGSGLLGLIRIARRNKS